MTFSERFRRLVICRLLGHKYSIQKQYGRLCKRCRVFKEGWD